MDQYNEAPAEDRFSNLVSEQDVIAHALVNPELARELTGILTNARMFTCPDHRKVWWLILRLVEANKDVDPMAVHQLACSTPLARYMDEIRGRRYRERPDDTTNMGGYLDFAKLSGLMSTAMPASGATRRAAALYDLWRHRSMVGEAEMFAQKARNGVSDVSVSAAILVEKLEELMRASLNPAKQSLKDIAKGAFDLADLGSVAYWGMPSLDRKLPIIKGAFFVLSGQSGSGKTFMAIESMIESAGRGIKCLFLTYEMTDRKLMQRVITTHERRPYDSIERDDREDAAERVHNAYGDLIEIDYSRPSAEQLGARLQRAHSEGVELVFIDHLNEMHSEAQGSTIVDAIDIATKAIMNTATDTGLPVIALAQHKGNSIKPLMDKEGAKIRDGQPMLSSLYGGKPIQQRAHAHVAVWPQVDEREERPTITPVLLCCDKNRDGSPFMLPVSFNGEINSWTAMSKEERATMMGGKAGSSPQAEPPMTKEKRYKGAHSEDEDLFQ